MEDDELFNCGRGSVFTSIGTIEMEASVMVTSLREDAYEDMDRDTYRDGEVKKGAGVIGLKNVRNPIKLAREVLLRKGVDSDGNIMDDGGSMHSQLVGPYVEALAKDWGLEFKPDDWFWTKRRWDEHKRGLRGTGQEIFDETREKIGSGVATGEVVEAMSQGTVGCVCLDQYGDLAVATSTGGMTNKWPGRVGDTPTLGAGFWAENWDVGPEDEMGGNTRSDMPFVNGLQSLLGDCLPAAFRSSTRSPAYAAVPSTPIYSDEKQAMVYGRPTSRRRAVAVSGTGNGDSFLRVAAARTACAMLRFSPPRSFPFTLAEAVSSVVGPGGELQRSAGRRWGKTGEGEGGMIGIEADTEKGRSSWLKEGKVVFDFNCGGMWRAWVEEDVNGKDRERVMVFREEYH